MSRVRRLSPWYWACVAAYLAVGALLVANLLFDWNQEWLILVANLCTLAVTIFVFRQMWKWSSHSPVNRDQPRADRRPEEK